MKFIYLNKIHHYLLFIDYLHIATLLESTQIANAAMSTAATAKKNEFESFITNTTVIKTVP